jgi:hypothetical protein
MSEIFAIVSCIILFGLAIFQLALILGAPIGKYAWGGAHTTLPRNLRIGSAISILLYGIFAIIILNKTEIILLFNDHAITDIGVWVLAAYFCIGAVMNGISRSKPERNLMTPIALVLAVLTLFIAIN